MAPKKTTRKPVKTAKLDVYYPEEVSIVYSNHANLALSNSDLILDFGLKEPLKADGTSELVTINARVVMSPQHAKVLTSKLIELIEVYEKKFGEIPAQSSSK